MLDQLTLQTIGILMTGISLTVAAAYYTLTLRNTQKNLQLQLETRQTQLFMQLYNRLNESAFCENYGKVVYRYEWEDFDDWNKKYHPNVDLDAWIPWVSLARYFVGIGTLVKRNLIDIDLVSDIMGGPVIWSWEKMSPIIKELKVYLKRPKLWDDFEYLYNEIQNIEQQKQIKF